MGQLRERLTFLGGEKLPRYKAELMEGIVNYCNGRIGNKGTNLDNILLYNSDEDGSIKTTQSLSMLRSDPFIHMLKRELGTIVQCYTLDSKTNIYRPLRL